MHKTITSLRYQQLVEWLKKERETAGISLRELASRLSKPHSFVQKTETLERRLDVAEYVQYCEALGIDPHKGITLLQNKGKRIF